MQLNTIDRPSRLLTPSDQPDFWRSEEGSFTIESVIWFPIFAILLAFIMNISIMFFAESQILRVVQDGNRAFSLGRLVTETQVEDYISKNLAYLEADIEIDTTISGRVVTTNVSVPAPDLMPLNFMTSVFSGVDIAVFAQQIVEF